MNIRTLIGVVAAVAVVAGGFYFFGGQAMSPTLSPQNPQSFDWTFRELPEQEGIPQTEVSLNGRVVGTYQGSCAEIEGSGWTLVAGEQSGVICWFAGGGKEIGVFAVESGGFEVMEGDLDEGSAEVAGMRGNFRILYTI